MKLRCCNKNQECIDFFAQYGTSSNPASGSFIPLNAIFRRGDEIHLEEETQIVLAPGYLYLIDYVFLATPEADGFMEIIPYINGTPRLLYSFFAPTGAERNTSASAGFTTNEAATSEARLSFRLDYPATTRNIDISGTVSITPLMKIGDERGTF